MARSYPITEATVTPPPSPPHGLPFVLFVSFVVLPPRLTPGCRYR